MLKKVLFSILLFLSCTPQSNAADNENTAMDVYPTIYKDSNVTIRQIDEHLWVGSGKKVSSETIYIVEGEERAVLIDAGMHMPGLRKIVESITSKPYDVLLSHNHGDHIGMCKEFDAVWISEADKAGLERSLRGYKGEIKTIEDGQIFELGGRQLEAILTPGHTPGSMTFMDKANHYGFSSDAFGNTNLLVTTSLSTVIETCQKTLKYMNKNEIYFFYNGHFYNNPETSKRVYDLILISQDILSGKVKGKTQLGRLKYIYERDGVRVNYGDEQLK